MWQHIILMQVGHESIEQRPRRLPCPIVLVKKRSGELRFCLDYRKLNEVSLSDSHPIPNLADILVSLGGATHFSTLNLRSGC